MAENSAQERTEQATPKRLQEARERGQVPRSRELTTMAVLLVSAAGMMLLGDGVVRQSLRTMELSFAAPRAELMDAASMLLKLQQAIIESVVALAPFLMVVMAVALLAPLALSGWAFSTKAMAFKWDKLDPVKGMGRVFGVRGLVELLKAMAKFGVVLAIAILLLLGNAEDLLGLGGMDVNTAIAGAGSLLLHAFLLLSGAMIVIAAIDVPFQLWDHKKQLRMTHQEIKEEFRQTDGSPEVKRRIREIQHEQSRRRMMDATPKADVVITNPTHYAVALRYDQSRMSAPVVVAKGRDLVALEIRNIALRHKVPILSAPPLARAIYYSTRLEQEIPSGLFLAVAQILAYAFQLRRKPRRGQGTNRDFNDLPIPDDLRRDD
ncbi:MAG: flagellar biosynthesis protein FlhB [Gammaproteobacteria bacterium]|nr:flagellar biosynthesis protein FlhB [Gammaproteobacteria bacterium]